MADRSDGDLTRILKDAIDVEADGLHSLLPVVYEELRRIASHYLGQERPGHTLSATALVHEAYLKLFQQDVVKWQNRAHFLAVASQAIRRILVDYARARHRDKRGGGWQRVPLSSIRPETPVADVDLLALEEALNRLALEDPREARIVEMRFFGGMGISEITEVMGVAERTVRRRLAYAKAWLYRELGNEGCL